MTKKEWLLVSLFSVAGSVGVASAQAGGPHFAKLDQNADGTVTTAEFEAGLLARFTESDTNGDGKVTADELKTARAAHGQAHFAKQDANGNGVLERSEVAKMPDALFTKLDVDNSKTLSAAELESGHPGGGHGKGPHEGQERGLPGDADRDGTLTKAEAVADAQKLAKRIDANSDGKLSADELQHARPGPQHHHGEKPAKATAGTRSVGE
jgi:EF hand domain-containing protein